MFVIMLLHKSSKGSILACTSYTLQCRNIDNHNMSVHHCENIRYFTTHSMEYRTRQANTSSSGQPTPFIWWNLNSVCVRVCVLHSAANIWHTCLSWCTPAVEAAHPINTSGTIEASSTCAVIDIDTTVRACPAIDTDAWEATDGVGASCTILTHTGPLSALVHILLAQLAHVRGRTQAGVPVDIVHTRRPVLAQVARTIIDILLAVFATVSWSRWEAVSISNWDITVYYCQLKHQKILHTVMPSHSTLGLSSPVTTC